MTNDEMLKLYKNATANRGGGGETLFIAQVLIDCTDRIVKALNGKKKAAKKDDA